MRQASPHIARARPIVGKSVPLHVSHATFCLTQTASRPNGIAASRSTDVAQQQQRALTTYRCSVTES